VREQERKHEELLAEFGVTDEEVEQWWERDEVDGREAAYQEQCLEEECRDLAGEFARESARRRGGDIGEIVDCYERIGMELLAARYSSPDGEFYSLGSVLRSETETDGKLKEFLKELDAWIERYVLRCMSREPMYHWKLGGSEDVRALEMLRGHAVSEGLMAALGVGYVKDRRTLNSFLWAVFKRWRKIFAPGSLWRERLITQQHLGKPEMVAQYVENVSAVAKCTNESHSESLRWRIRQHCSRDRRTALKRRK
jgi:hypothetical protein